MQIGSGETTYQWNDNWAKTPATESASAGWAHHGVAITEADDIVSYHQQDSTLLLFDRDGNLKRSWPSGLTEGHGITLVKEGDTIKKGQRIATMGTCGSPTAVVSAIPATATPIPTVTGHR